MNSKPLVIFIVLLLIGVSTYLLMSNDPETTEIVSQNSPTSTNGTTNTASGTPNVTGTTSFVNLAENVTGNFAVVTNAKLAKAGYVVIYRVNSNSDSEVLGNSALLTAGTHNNIRIQLSEVASKQQSLIAVLHEDDGDGTFEFPTSDFYLSNATERVVMDADIVDVSGESERVLLDAQVSTFLENAVSTSSPFME